MSFKYNALRLFNILSRIVTDPVTVDVFEKLKIFV